jgi:hypothetical protein
MATFSMVLGILPWCCLGYLTAVPAIITGLVALGDIRTQRGRLRGKSRAIAGIGSGTAFVALIALVTAFALARVRLPSRDVDASVPCDMKRNQDRPAATFGAEVDAWSQARDKLSSTKARLTKDREDLIGRLGRLGVRSSEDMEHCDPQGRVYAKELVALEEQLRTIDRHLSVYDETVAQAESVRRRIARGEIMQDLQTQQKELAKFRRSMMAIESDLDRELSSVSGDLDFETRLDRALRRPHNEN